MPEIGKSKVDMLSAESTAVPDLSKIVRAVREIVAEQPNHAYRPPLEPPLLPPWFETSEECCLYVEDGPEGPRPSCLIGCAAIRSGLPIAEVATWDYRPESGIHLVMHSYGLHGQEILWLREIQFWQDKRVTWETATRYADTYFELHHGGVQW